MCSCKKEFIYGEKEGRLPGKCLATRKKQVLFFFRLPKQTKKDFQEKVRPLLSHSFNNTLNPSYASIISEGSSFDTSA